MKFNLCQSKPISISLSPNTEKDDVILALKLLFQPWRWQAGKAIEKIEEEFRNYLGVKYTISFNSGRSALLATLSSVALAKEGEVLLQAFTCNAVPNPIIWALLRDNAPAGQAGLKPVYVDCNDDFNIDIEDLREKITLRQAQGKKPKAVIVQHTFGNPADMDEIIAICKENNLLLIEDCAHALGAEYRGSKVGTMGDVAFFSFSRDKVISSVYGGMVATNNEKIAREIMEFRNEIDYPGLVWIKQQLLHPILMNWKILPTYKILGKYCLILFQWLHIFSKAVHWKEKRGIKPDYFPKRLPNALATLALNQFKKLERFNNHRKEIANFYRNELKETKFELPEIKTDRIPNYLRFTVIHPDAHEIIRKAWDNNLLIGDWYTTPIAPHDTKIEKVYYNAGSCPNAEKLAKITLNLPTHINISKQDAEKIIDFLKNF